MTPRRRPSIKRSIFGVVTALALLATTVAAAFAYLTAALRGSSEAIESSAESVKVVEETQRDLLLHELSSDPRTRAQLVAAMHAGFSAAAQYVGSEAEARSLEGARQSVIAYLGAPDDPARAAAFKQAYRAIGKLVDVNVADARAEQARAAHYSHLATRLGVANAVLLAAMVVAVAWWLERRAFRPVLALAAAIERFKAGDRDARAPTLGPIELSEMARRFNDLADSQAHQREQQMAFLAGIAHDLRNPLSALKCSRGVVHPDKPLPAEPVIRKAFELVQRQADRMERLVSDFLDTARIEAGQLKLEKTPCDLRETARSVCALYENADARHPVLLEAPEEPLIVECDGQRIEQVLGNLVSNAIKYSPDGGAVHLRLRRDEVEIELSVSDHGVGIAEEDRERVFEPFQRTGHQRSSIPGMGLGLFVVRRIVEGHGGRIGVESRPGEGTTFTLRLPAVGLAVAPERG
ncbi:MAG: HAMP domain-containing sensor histidine kinase [Myxococcales bacterium]